MARTVGKNNGAVVKQDSFHVGLLTLYCQHCPQFLPIQIAALNSEAGCEHWFEGWNRERE